MSKPNFLLIDTLKYLIESKEKEIGVLERNNLALRKENDSLKKRLTSQEGYMSRGDSVGSSFEERLN